MNLKLIKQLQLLQVTNIGKMQTSRMFMPSVGELITLTIFVSNTDMKKVVSGALSVCIG